METYTNIFSTTLAFNSVRLDSLKIVHLFVNNAVHNANNAKDQRIFVHNVQTNFKTFLYRQEHALITVQLVNSLTRELEVAQTVKLLVRFAPVLTNAHHVKITFFFIMELVEKNVHLIWLRAQISINASTVWSLVNRVL